MFLARRLGFCENGDNFAVSAVFVGKWVGGISEIEAYGCIKLVHISVYAVCC
jgi:hypothetical protein